MQIKRTIGGIFSLVAGILFFACPVYGYTMENNLLHFAGTGQVGDLDGDIYKARFDLPYGLAVDKDGNILIVDSLNSKIKRISNNQVVTIAGGNSDSASLLKPRDIAVDAKGALYVSDTGNHVIKRIYNGQVTTFADANFNCPSGLAVDAQDNIYVADTMNNVIRKIDQSGKVTTFAGVMSNQGKYKDGKKEEACFNEPADLAIDSQGVMYVTDSGNQCIRRIKEGLVTTVAGKPTTALTGTSYYQGGFLDGSAEQALFNFPKGIMVLDGGAIIVADSWNHRIRALKENGDVVTVAGTGTPGEKDGELEAGELNGPIGLVYKEGVLYISEIWNNDVRALEISEETINSLEPQNDLTEIQVWFDKKKISFTDVKPMIIDNRVMVPLRRLVEAWEGEIIWHETSRSIEVRKDRWRTKVYLDKDPLRLYRDRTMIQLRFLAESMGFEVQWVPEHRAVVISSK